MEMEMIKAVIERGLQGRVQINIAKQLGLTQTVVAYILKEQRNGKSPQAIKALLEKGAGKK